MERRTAVSSEAIMATLAAFNPQSWYYLAYPVLLAAGMAITWVNTRRTEAMKGDMAHVSEQLREFYGPLQSIAAATKASYEAMIEQFLERRTGEVPLTNPWDDGSDVTSTYSTNTHSVGAQRDDVWKKKKFEAASRELRMRQQKEKKAWHAALAEDGPNAASKHYRLWAAEVLQPLNERALEIIIRRSDLLNSSNLPVVFRQFAAHTLAFRALLAQWRSGDFSETRCAVRYPEAFGIFVWAEFKRLKLRQAEQQDTLRTMRRGGTSLPWIGFGFVEMKNLQEGENGVSTDRTVKNGDVDDGISGEVHEDSHEHIPWNFPGWIRNRSDSTDGTQTVPASHWTFPGLPRPGLRSRL